MALPLKYNYAHLTGAGNTTLVTGPGVLHSITVNTAGTNVSAYDNLTTGTNPIAINAGTAIGNFLYDVGFSRGLTITIGATIDVTVAYAIG
jgi:hypothetical protein